MMKRILNQLHLWFWFILGMFIFSTQIHANVRKDMSLICKYEASRNYGIRQNTSKIFSVERVGNRFLVHGKASKYSKRAFRFKCTFDRQGEYIGIKKIKDKRYLNSRREDHVYLPTTVKRVCKGEASVRWHMRPRDVKIKNVKRLGHHDYVVTLAGRGYRGKCEVSQSGHMYQFRTHTLGYDINNEIPKVVRRNCKKHAAFRWGVRPSEIRIDYARRLGRDDYVIQLSSRYDRAECEVSRRGHIYLFSEY